MIRLVVQHPWQRLVSLLSMVDQPRKSFKLLSVELNISSVLHVGFVRHFRVISNKSTGDIPHGLVQVPCVERNFLGAIKALCAAQLSLNTRGEHVVSFDMSLKAMRDTAALMSTQLKETSLAGLATSVKIPVSVPEC